MSETPQPAYPAELGAFVRQRWPDDATYPLPRRDILDELLSTAYQASLLSEESRPVQCRLLFIQADALPADGGPPTGFHRLRFAPPRPFSDHEVRRLFRAAKYQRALIGVGLDDDGKLAIWGIIQSGPRWLVAAHGMRADPAPMPRALIVRVSGPGRVAVACGATTIAELRGGRLTNTTMDVFASAWLGERFGNVRDEFRTLLAEGERNAGQRWARVQPDVIRSMTQQVFRRLVATIRSGHHGGAVLILPPECIRGIADGRYVRLKYTFADEEPRRRHRSLLFELVSTLAADGDPDGPPVGWEAYHASRKIAALEESLLEVAHLFAALADVDGAVVVTPRLEFLGFGAEIGGDMPNVDRVFRALDLEATTREEERVDSEGTRHRSAYRLCAQFHDALAIVVSQDGAARFVAWHEGAVTFWDHASLGGEA